MRSVSDRFRAAIYSRLTDETKIGLVTIDSPELEETHRIAEKATQRLPSDPNEIIYGTVSRGETYLYMPFMFGVPRDRSQEAPRVTIRISNIHRDLVGLLRSIREPLEIKIETVLRSQPDVPDIVLPEYLFRSVVVDELWIEAELRLDNLANEPFPQHRMSPSTTPALFRTGA